MDLSSKKTCIIMPAAATAATLLHFNKRCKFNMKSVIVGHSNGRHELGVYANSQMN